MTEPTSNAPTKLRCPHCSKVFFYSKENPFRPFCSERCKLIDFGDWIDETHRIPGDEAGSPPATED